MSTPTCTAGGKRRKMKGGMGYGFRGDTLGSAGAVWGPSNTSLQMTSSGGVSDEFPGVNPDNNAKVGGRKSRKSRKTKKSKKTRKTRKTRASRGRKMRGGMYGANGVVNSAGAGYGFVAGDPTIRGGIAPVAGYNSRMGGAPMDDAGVRQTSS